MTHPSVKHESPVPSYLDSSAAFLLRLGTGAQMLPAEALPGTSPAVIFANHSSHLDAPLIWACLPPQWRAHTRPVAARDYWERGRLRRCLATRILNALLIERQSVSIRNNPLKDLRDALDRGESLILFPEGTRSADGSIRPFKSGLYHLARQRADLPLVPVYIDNLSRILPKGELLPVPFISSLFAGPPIRLAPGEEKTRFLERARDAVLALKNS